MPKLVPESLILSGPMTVCCAMSRARDEKPDGRSSEQNRPNRIGRRGARATGTHVPPLTEHTFSTPEGRIETMIREMLGTAEGILQDLHNDHSEVDTLLGNIMDSPDRAERDRLFSGRRGRPLT